MSTLLDETPPCDLWVQVIQSALMLSVFVRWLVLKGSALGQQKESMGSIRKVKEIYPWKEDSGSRNTPI